MVAVARPRALMLIALVLVAPALWWIGLVTLAVAGLAALR
jgi:hypothetical protein